MKLGGGAGVGVGREFFPRTRSLLSMARQTDAGGWESQRPDDVSPGLRVVVTGDPGSSRRRLLHDCGRGRGHPSSFLSPLNHPHAWCQPLLQA